MTPPVIDVDVVGEAGHQQGIEQRTAAGVAHRRAVERGPAAAPGGVGAGGGELVGRLHSLILHRVLAR